jgi:hypothetical protein
MKKIALLFALAILFPGYKILHGQTAECQKKCEDQKKQCSIRCQVMGADNTGCEEQCVKESARCLGACKSAVPRGDSCINDDSDYEDDEADEDDGEDDIDADPDFDKDDDFSDMEEDFCN